MKYDVTTERVAQFNYVIDAENEEDAGNAALALMDAEQWYASYTGAFEIDYEHELGQVQEGTENRDSPMVFNAKEVLAAYEDGFTIEPTVDIARRVYKWDEGSAAGGQ